MKNRFKKKYRIPYTVHHTQKGFVLILSVIISSILLSVGLSMYSIALKEIILSSSGRNSQSSFYAADSALECAIYWDIRHPSYPASIFGSTGNTLRNGLMGYWKFDESSGISAIDSSNYSNNGILTDMDPFTDWVSGKINNALDFDGANDYVSMGDTQNISGAISVSAWFKVSAFNYDWQTLISKGDQTYRISRYSNSNKVSFDLGNWPIYSSVVSTSSVDDGNWHLVVGTFTGGNGGIQKIYLDGVEEASVVRNFNDWSNDSYNFLIGENDQIRGRYWNGQIDEVRIYNRALIDSEITDLYSLVASSSPFEPIPKNSSVYCNEEDITNPATGWDTGAGWDVSGVSSMGATTVFDMAFENGSCATVTVVKDNGTTRIDSRGYNTCNLNYSRRVERGLRVRY